MKQPTEKTIAKLDRIFAQGDARYYDAQMDYEVGFFVENEGIAIEKEKINVSKEPTEEDLKKIDGPQERYKYIEANVLVEKDMYVRAYEFSVDGPRADVGAHDPETGETILVECCSCAHYKAILYLRGPEVIL